MQFVFSQEELNWDLKGIPCSAGEVGWYMETREMVH